MTRPVKVAMLGQYPVQPSRPNGGVEAVMTVLCREMARRPEVELSVLSCTTAPDGHLYEQEAGMTRCSIQRRRLGRATFYWRDVRALHGLLRDFGPDVMHAHGTGLYAAAVLSGHFPASVVTPHGIVACEAKLARGLRERVGWYLQARWEARVLRRASHIISISPYIQRELSHLCRATFHFIENPVDDCYFSLGDVPSSGCLLWIGRLIPRKDPQTAVRAFARVNQAFPHARLRIVGEASSHAAYARATKDLTSQLGLGNVVQFLGQLDQKALLDELQAAQVVLVTSLQETAPVVIAEAMAGGRPVVATDVGGCGHLIRQGHTGLLAPKGDELMLAQHVNSLLASSDLTVRLSKAARQEAQTRFRAALAVDQTLLLYKHLLSKRPSSDRLRDSGQAMKL